jgi:hypothetical protein
VSSGSIILKNKESFWKTFDDSIQGVSSWSLKIAVLFSKPPCPEREDVAPLLSGLEKMVQSLVSAYSALSADRGLTLQSEVKAAVLCILTSCQEFLVCIGRYGCSSESQERVLRTARINELCDKTIKTLSKDNIAAVFRVLLCQLQLLQDATKELEEVARENGRQELFDCDSEDGDSEDGDDTCEWTASDKEFLLPCLELAKVIPDMVMILSRNLVRNGQLSTVECVMDMDHIANAVQRLSPLIDDLGTAVYAPVSKQQISEVMQSVSGAVEDVLKCWEKSHFWTEIKDDPNSPHLCSKRVQKILQNVPK